MATDLGVKVTEEGKYYFISYNTEDAYLVSRYLKKMAGYGLPVWYDYGIPLGEKWEEIIAEKIKYCESMIMFLSSKLFKKENSYVKKEWSLAKNKKKNVWIVFLDEIDEESIPSKYDSWWDDIKALHTILAYTMELDDCVDDILMHVGYKREVVETPLLSLINDDFDIEAGVLKKYKGNDSVVVIPDGVTEIGSNAFLDCNFLIEIIIPESVKYIGYYAFKNCSSLTSIVIPKTVIRIDRGIFDGCDSIENITLPFIPEGMGVVNQSNYNYSGIPRISRLIYHSGLSEYFSGDSEKIPKSLSKVTITSGRIPTDAFLLCESINTIKIGKGVSEIASNAFLLCSKLVEIINKSLIDISLENTYGANYVLEVHIGKSKIVNYNEFLFYTYNDINYLVGYKGKKTRLVLPEKYNGQLYKVAPYAFLDCEFLENIEISDSVTSIGEGAFSRCESLKNVEIPDSVTSIGEGAFQSCKSLENIGIPDSVTTIGAYTFSGCESLKSVIIPNSVTTIGEDAFSRCKSLKSIIIPNSVTTIGKAAFSWCESLKSVIIPNSVTTIGAYAFSGCESLKIIKYEGTKIQWKNIHFETNWDNGTPSNKKIICKLI